MGDPRPHHPKDRRRGWTPEEQRKRLRETHNKRTEKYEELVLRAEFGYPQLVGGVWIYAPYLDEEDV